MAIDTNLKNESCAEEFVPSYGQGLVSCRSSDHPRFHVHGSDAEDGVVDSWLRVAFFLTTSHRKASSFSFRSRSTFASVSGFAMKFICQMAA